MLTVSRTKAGCRAHSSPGAGIRDSKNTNKTPAKAPKETAWNGFKSLEMTSYSYTCKSLDYSSKGHLQGRLVLTKEMGQMPNPCTSYDCALCSQLHLCFLQRQPSQSPQACRGKTGFYN